ncbi:hypothetical protein SAMN05518800_6796 [Variovorax sp. YR752]|uniref:hypothetical protein n=1 Tax=unclassified Variovorax TaxID=663243 RepID=UPI000BC51241|nr:hypothetical protein [Variovorax sp. YR752]SOE06171.1 hypothetical protein SAMN05518800_6796 [Variovorax sp. YR752]
MNADIALVLSQERPRGRLLEEGDIEAVSLDRGDGRVRQPGALRDDASEGGEQISRLV